MIHECVHYSNNLVSFVSSREFRECLQGLGYNINFDIIADCCVLGMCELHHLFTLTSFRKKCNTACMQLYSHVHCWL